MAHNKWDDESDEESTPATSPAPPVARRRFDDEESEEDTQVLESWDAADDSETERTKAKKAEEDKAKADAAAKAAHKSKTARIAERLAEKARRREMDEEDTSDSEDEATRRARLRRTEIDSDLAHAEDLFGDLQVTNTRRNPVKPVTLSHPKDPNQTIDLTTLPIFNPATKDQFTKLRDALTPLLSANSKKAHYTLFMQEFTKQICKDLPSDQIKKIASGLTTLSNEKMKEEKLAEKGGKKTKAQKTKAVLHADRGASNKAYADTSAYDGHDGLDEDDFM